jgi:hypothetical protein
MGGTRSSVGHPRNEFKIKWIGFFRRSRGGKSCKLGENMEYCEY